MSNAPASDYAEEAQKVIDSYGNIPKPVITALKRICQVPSLKKFKEIPDLALSDMRKLCSFDDTPFVPDPYQTAFNCGRQSLLKDILWAIEQANKPVKRQTKAERVE
jgi:hypothetical protein